MTVQIRGGAIPPKEHRKLRVEDAVESILDRMIFAKPMRGKDIRRDCLFAPHEMGPMWARSPMRDDEGMMFWGHEEVNAPDLVWPVKTGVVFHNRISAEWGDHLHCLYAQSIDARLLRGQYKFVGRHNLAVYEGFLERDGKWSSVVSHASWRFGRWQDAGRIRYNQAFIEGVRPEGGAPVVIGSKVEDGELTVGDRAAFAQSIALTYRYEWGAQFSIGGSAKIIIPTTAAGAMELFNDRDKPEDRDRRAALRHWVRQHLRTSAGGDFSKVRAHMRGNVSFSWRGFDVVIRPSQFDEEQNGNGT